MIAGDKTECLRVLTFGNQVAEEERDTLKEYFVTTQAWDRILRGEVDIVYGPKGSGKSALYVLTQEYVDDLFNQNVVQIAAENPRGAPAFKDLDIDPPTTEREFSGIWKLYFVSLLGRVLVDFGINNEHSRRAKEVLSAHDLLPNERTTLGAILSAARQYVSRLTRPKSLEGGVVLDQSTGVATALTAKITFEDPNIAAEKAGYISVDGLLSEIDLALKDVGFTAWLMIDRLDVAFDESSDLERNALRALFRVYRDLRMFDYIKLKIFLRSDIWTRITEDGFREATHMSRDISLIWDKESLRNLVVRRLLSNQLLLEKYDIDKDEVLGSSSLQLSVFSMVFPDQVEVGEKQSTTFDWLLKRAADGFGNVQPRDVIFFLNKLVEVQNRRLERGEPEPPGTWLFDRASFKEAMPLLSEHKVTKVIFAEYPDLRPKVEALREAKTEHNIVSLARIWGLSENEAKETAKRLRDIGFFEERTSHGEGTYWVPFIFRSYLAMIQGKVEDLQVHAEDLVDD